MKKSEKRRQTHRDEPAKNKDSRRNKPEQRQAIRYQTVICLSRHGCAKNIAQMASRDPYRPHRQKDESTVRFQNQNLTRFCLLPGKTHIKSRASHHPFFDNSDKAKSPETEEDIQITHISKAQNRRQNTQIERWKIARNGHLFGQITVVNANSGQANGKITENIPDKNTENNKKPHPEEFIPKNTGYNAARFIKALGQCNRKSRERKSETLVLLPLLLKNDRKAQSSNNKGNRHGEPPVQ